MNKAITLAVFTSMTSASFAALSVLPTTLYEFSNGSSTTDSMGNQNLTTEGTSTASGLFGDGVDATSTASYYRGPTSGSNATSLTNGSWSTQPGTTDFAVSFWINPGDANPTGGFIMPVSQGARWGGGPNQTAGWNFELETSGNLKFSYGDINSTGTRSTISGAGTLALNTWNHVAVIRAGANVTYYLNGSSLGTNTDAATMDIGVNNTAGEWFRELTIGNGLNSGGSSMGAGAAVDDLAFWRGSSITTDDIAQIYNSGTGASIASLSVPEPSSTALLGLGGLALILRRRK